jgi:hypothetical protein
MGELSREQVEEWRGWILSRLPNHFRHDELTESSAEVNAIFDAALRSVSGRAGVIEECARVLDSAAEHYKGTGIIVGILKDEANHIRAIKPAPNEMAEMPERRATLRITELLRDERWHQLSAGEQNQRLKDAANTIEACLEANDLLLKRRLSDAGTVRVPREPTMGQWDDFCSVYKVPFDKFIAAYKAMLDAALRGEEGK